MKLKFLLSLITIAVLLGFTSTSDQLKARMEQMPQHYAQFDAKLGWMVSSGANSMTINGIIQNTRYAIMEDIEVRVSVRDANGKESARSVSFIFPNRLARDDYAPFAITLPVAATANSKLLFTYSYLGSDSDGSDGGATSWMQSFEAEPRI